MKEGGGEGERGLTGGHTGETRRPEHGWTAGEEGGATKGPHKGLVRERRDFGEEKNEGVRGRRRNSSCPERNGNCLGGSGLTGLQLRSDRPPLKNCPKQLVAGLTAPQRRLDRGSQIFTQKIEPRKERI